MIDPMAYRTYFEIEFMKQGFNKALYTMQDLFQKYEPGYKKGSKLNSFKGISFIIKKLIENKEDFFVKGEEINLVYLQEEYEEYNKKSNRKK